MRNLLNSFAANFLQLITNFVGGVLAARLLLPTARGEFGEILLWPTLIAALGAFSIPDAIIFHIASGREKPEKVVTAALANGMLLSILLGAVGIVATPYLHAGDRPEVLSAAYLYLLYIPLGYVSIYVVCTFQGALKFDLWNLLRPMASVVYAAIALLIWWTGTASIMAFVIAMLLSNFAVFAFGFLTLIRKGWIELKPERRIMSALLGYGARLHLGELLSLANQRVDQIMIAGWLSAAAFGYYAIALSVVGSAIGLVTMLGQLVFPKVAAEADFDACAAVIGRYMRLAVALAATGSVALLLLAPWLVVLVYGAAYEPAIPVLQLLALAILPMACKAIFAATFKAFGRARMIVLAELTALVVNAAGQFALVPRFGILGAAAAMVAAQFLASVVLALSLRLQVGMALLPLFIPSAADLRLVVASLTGRPT